MMNRIYQGRNISAAAKTQQAGRRPVRLVKKEDAFRPVSLHGGEKERVALQTLS